MTIAEEIKAAYASARNFPELAEKLVYAGVRSYTVDAATGITLYRLENGSIHLKTTDTEPKSISPVFDEGQTIAAIRDNQQGNTDYAGFMQAIATAGVRFYECTLNGNSKRVTYIGGGGFYEELIPV
jgi:uncharacterized protein YbcV (DUF1398 family)